jgi:Domain of unknown function (DUF222)/HNH endonuclease
MYHVVMEAGAGTQFTSTGELLDALAAHEAEAARLALVIRGLERDGAWALDGSVSLAAWLREHARLSHRDANRWVAAGRFLAGFDAIAHAAVTHRLSAGQVAAIQRACTAKLEPVLQHTQDELADAVAELNVADTETACALWKQRAEALIDGNEPKVPDRSLSFSRSNGAMVGNFVLDDHGSEQFEQAIRTASTWDGADETRTAAQVSADALVDIAAFYNANHDQPGTPRHKPHASISVDESTLHDRPEAFNTAGALIDAAAVDTLLCDCTIQEVLRRDGVPIALGRTRYLIGKDLFAFVAARDGGCRFPGCDRPVRFTEAHHIRYWRHGGSTDPDNLVLLCSRHHHTVHQHDLELKLLPDAELHVTWANGQHRTSQPRGAPPTTRRRTAAPGNNPA